MINHANRLSRTFSLMKQVPIMESPLTPVQAACTVRPCLIALLKQQQPIKIPNCQHEFKEVMRIRKLIFWRIFLPKRFDSVYSKCQNCGILRHDNDGDLFYGGIIND